MNVPKLVGNLAELYALKATRRTNLGSAKYFEFIDRICDSWTGAQHLELRALGLSANGAIYKGVNARGAWRWYPTPISRAEFERLYNSPESIYNN